MNTGSTYQVSVIMASVSWKLGFVNLSSDRPCLKWCTSTQCDNNDNVPNSALCRVSTQGCCINTSLSRLWEKLKGGFLTAETCRQLQSNSRSLFAKWLKHQFTPLFPEVFAWKKHSSTSTSDSNASWQLICFIHALLNFHNFSRFWTIQRGF